jgi:DNA-binding Lrp family transcriptional regulator
MDDLSSTDRRMLAAIVQQIEHDGRDVADMAAISAELGLEAAQTGRSLRRLVDANMVRGKGMLGGNWIVAGVAERGLREVGAWPDRADQLAAQLIAALAEAAEREPEPEKKSGLRTAATGVGRDVLTDVLAAYMAR